MGLILALRFVRFGVVLSFLVFVLAHALGFDGDYKRPLTLAYLFGLYVFLIGNVLCVLRFHTYQQRFLLVFPVLFGAFGPGLQSSSWGLALWALLLLGWIQAFVSEAERAPGLGQVRALRLAQLCLAVLPLFFGLSDWVGHSLGIIGTFIFAVTLIWAWTRWLSGLRGLDAFLDHQDDDDQDGKGSASGPKTN